MSNFKPLFPTENSKVKRKSKRKTKAEIRKEKDQENLKIGKENLSKLNSMVVPLLVFHASQNKNEWLVQSAKVALEEPHRLTEKWINSLNKWCSETSHAMTLEQPELEIKQRYVFDNLKITKIIPPKEDQLYQVPALMSVDSKGWKYYFKTKHANTYNVGDIISFKATVKGHAEGITFLSRASSITQNLFGGQDDQ